MDWTVENKKTGRPCSDELLRLSFRSKNTQIVGNKRSLIPFANSRPDVVFRTIDSPFVKIPPRIERTCAVSSSQIPFSGEFSTPKAEFATENGGCTAQNEYGLYDCRKTEKQRSLLERILEIGIIRLLCLGALKYIVYYSRR